MIQISFPNFSDKTDEGKLLLSAMAVLTSIDCKDIKDDKFGGMSTPSQVFDIIQDIANKIYYEEEYLKYLESVKRDNKIKEIIDSTNF